MAIILTAQSDGTGTRVRVGRRRITFRTVLALAALSGCTATGDKLGPPTVAEVHAYAQQCGQPVDGQSAAGAALTGVALVELRCGEFFDRLIELQHNVGFARQGLSTGNTQAAAILAALKQSATSIAILAAATEFATSLLDSYSRTYTFANYAGDLRRLVFEAMGAHKRSDEFKFSIEILSSADGRGTSYCMAQRVIQDYARICTVSGIESLTRQAIAKSEVKDFNRSESGAKGARPERPHQSDNLDLLLQSPQLVVE